MERWEPSYGFCATNETERKSLAMTLEALRRQVCAYGGGEHCDCKYGLTVDSEIAPVGQELFVDKGIRQWRYDFKERRRVVKPVFVGTEATGCPELRELIHRLMHRDAPLI